MKYAVSFLLAVLLVHGLQALDHPGMAVAAGEGLAVIQDGHPMVRIEVAEGTDHAVVRAAKDLSEDFKRVCGDTGHAREARAIRVSVVPDGRWEAYTMTVEKDGIRIVGSDRRGAIYGIYELSEQLGVSPWYWWADVPVAKKTDLVLRYGSYTACEPKVKYRGIFINDEWPSFGGWTCAKFGGFNSKMYAHLFELLLRLRANYLWPAMWSGAFGEDDPQNQTLAQAYGIVMGTSHHEPMMRAHKEYSHRKQQIGAWNFEANRENVEQFFRAGAERAKGCESLFTLGMRGDGDVAMGNNDGEAMKTLSNVINAQRAIIQEVYGQPDAVPQLWAIFTEVQRYYDAGFTVPDDVTLLFCDNNWGYVRRTGTPEVKARKGGAGLYYHIDMNGGPWNDRWINTTTVPKLREQLNLAYQTGLDRIWIVNVGDLKPKEVPIDFILRYAWNPESVKPGDEMMYLQDFAASAFGRPFAKEAAEIIAGYSALNLMRKPEVQKVGLFNDAECQRLDAAWQRVADRAEALKAKIPAEAQDAYFELVYYPAVASAGVAQMYLAATLGDSNRVDRLFQRDRELEEYYNTELAGGKWKGMMKDVHVGYTKWSMPKENVKPESHRSDGCAEAARTSILPCALAVDRFSASHAAPDASWIVLPGLGRFGAALGSSNVVAASHPIGDGASVDYPLEVAADGRLELVIGILPTQDVNPSRGLRLGVRLDGGPLVTLDARQGMQDIFGEYTHENLKRCKNLKPLPPMSRHALAAKGQPMRSEIFDNVRWLDAAFPSVSRGRHTLSLVMIDPEIVVERIVVNPDDEGKSYFGPVASPIGD